MAAATSSEPIPRAPATPQWNLATRVAFRFTFLYFGLFCLTTQIAGGLLPIPSFDVPDPSTLWPIKQIVTWLAVHLFRVTQPLVYFSGSGDKTFDWVLSFFLLGVAVIAAAVWSVADRKPKSYINLYKWFRLFLRFALASQMLVYGFAKAVPLQMPFPYLPQLVEPYGNFSPMGVLWSSIGASPAYEIFAGCAELLAGILLLVPRTTMLGALICLADSVEIFMLNMAYDVPVKLFSFHLILFAVFLLAPELPRLADFFLLDRASSPSKLPSLFSSPRANRIAVVLQVMFGFCLIAANAYGSWKGWFMYGGGRAKSPLYGIWDVERMSIDGQERSPLLTDYGRWRRAIFDFSTATAFQHMDNSIAYYSSSIDAKGRTLQFTRGNAKSKLTFQRPAPDRLILDGDMDNHKVHMQLHRFDRNQFLLVNRGFHWIQEYPFNR
jgi:uncharacterized membrane protein YphA (DoxX/SURF4 family)